MPENCKFSYPPAASPITFAGAKLHRALPALYYPANIRRLLVLLYRWYDAGSVSLSQMGVPSSTTYLRYFIIPTKISVKRVNAPFM
jgi:hypothetical protein